jgi:hypothetical protein
MFKKSLQLIRILLSKRGRNLLKKMNSTTVIVNLQDAVILRNHIFEELKYQNNIYHALRITKEVSEKNETFAFVEGIEKTLDELGKDYKLVKKKLLQANYLIHNNDYILDLEFYTKKLENLEKFANNRRKIHINLFNRLNYVKRVLTLKNKIESLSVKLNKNNTSHIIKVKLNYKYYKNLTKITKTIVK